MKKALYTTLAILAIVNVNAKETINNSKPALQNQLLFIENKGQVVDQHGNHRNDIDFKLDCGAMVLFIGDGQLHYQWTRTENTEPQTPNTQSQKPNTQFEAITNRKPQIINVSSYRMDVTLLGANKNAQVITEQPQEYKENYYLPQCPNGATANSCKKIIYKDIYPSIDWVIYISHETSLKYDFVVHPGGDLSQIKLQYGGATSLALVDGALVVETPYGTITENAPYTYYADTKEEITSSFDLKENILSYNIRKSQITDHKSQIVIDPTLSWATYFGGAANEAQNVSTMDTAGNSYLVGITRSSANIATSGTHQTSFAGTTDGYAVKFNSTGARQWGTYYGGVGGEEFLNLAVDLIGNLYAVGRTATNTGITTIGAHQTTFGGGPTDGLVVKLNTSNGTRIWGSYYGGSDNEEIYGVCVDRNGNIYFGGITNSTNGMISTNPFQSTPGDGFIVKFDASGVRQWGSYYNGRVYSTTTDAFNNLFFSGTTYTTTNIATTGSHQTSFGGNADAYIAKFAPTGARIWGTYYGGTNLEHGFVIKCDPEGNVYTGGITFSANTSNAIATTGAFQTSYLGVGAAFLVKFNTNGVRQWGTYYGSSSATFAIINSVVTDSRGHIYIFGSTNSPANVATANGYKNTLTGSLGLVDAFMAVFAGDGHRLYGTYYGGPNDEDGFNIPGNGGYAKGRITFGGHTKSTSGIATAGTHQTSFGGDQDGFLVQFATDTLVYIKQPFADTVICQGDSLHIPYGAQQPFRSTNTFTFQLSDASGSFSSPTNLGTVNGQVGGVFVWRVPPTFTIGSGYRVRVLASAPFDTAYEEANIRIKGNSFPTAGANTPVCSGYPLNLTATATITTGVTFSWSGPSSYTSNLQNPTLSNPQVIHTGNFIVTTTLNGCTAKDTVAVVVNQTPATPVASNNGPLCVGSNINLTASTVAGALYTWTGPAGFSSNSQNPTIANGQTIHSGTYSVTTTANGCTSPAANTPVVLNQGPSILIYPSPKDTICAGRPLTLNATITNPGSGPGYQWQRNSGAAPGLNTGTTYTSAVVNDKDTFFLLLTPGAGAGCTTPVNSNKIVVTVLPQMMPSVTMTGTDSGAWPGLLVNFEATPTNGGNSPKYQWLVNNLPIVGAISDKWGTTTLKNGDSVCVALYTSYECPNPAVVKACKQVKIATGIKEVNAHDLLVNPNPFTTELIVSAPLWRGQPSTNNYWPGGRGVSLLDIYGRIVYTAKLNATQTVINTSALTPGNYVLIVTDSEGNSTVHKIIKR